MSELSTFRRGHSAASARGATSSQAPCQVGHQFPAPEAVVPLPLPFIDMLGQLLKNRAPPPR